MLELAPLIKCNTSMHKWDHMKLTMGCCWALCLGYGTEKGVNMAKKGVNMAKEL